MTSRVFWGSPRQGQLEREEALPAKLDLILEKLNLRDRVKDLRVAIKMHLGSGDTYSTVAPVYVRKIVQAVLDGGGQPFVTDLPHAVVDAHLRGYTPETIGCPLYPSTGLDEKWTVAHPYSFRQMTEFHVGGPIAEASFLIDLAHVKGCPATAWGAAIKNIALGCMDQRTRMAMHAVSHFEPYFFPEKCPDDATKEAIRATCPYDAIRIDEKSGELRLRYFWCNQCMRCQVVANGALAIKRSNFMAFLEVTNVAAKLVLDTFEPGHAVFINLATHMTPLCDCFGFTGLPVLPDAGIFGSDDIVAVEQATLDMTAGSSIIEENLPGAMEIVTREGHPWQWLHGPYRDPYEHLELAEKLGLGSRQYELVDVLPVKDPA